MWIVISLVIYRFGEEPFNLQESVCKKTHFAMIHLQECIVIYQNNFEQLAEVNISIIIKISRKYNLTNENQFQNVRENIFQGNALRPLYVN